MYFMVILIRVFFFDESWIMADMCLLISITIVGAQTLIIWKSSMIKFQMVLKNKGDEIKNLSSNIFNFNS